MRLILTVLALGLTFATARAAEPITLELKEFKLTNPTGEAVEADIVGYNEDDMKIFFYAPGLATATVKVPTAGDYKLVIEASCDEALNEKAAMSVKVGDKVVDKDFKLKETDKKEYEFKVTLKKGETKVALGFHQ